MPIVFTEIKTKISHAYQYRSLFVSEFQFVQGKLGPCKSESVIKAKMILLKISHLMFFQIPFPHFYLETIFCRKHCLDLFR